MDRALYRTIKEAMLRNVEGSQIAWCQYGSLLHSSELLKRDEQQMVNVIKSVQFSNFSFINFIDNELDTTTFFAMKKYFISLIPR